MGGSLNSLDRDRILITGGSGFVGSAVIEKLKEHGYSSCFAPTHQQYDLNREDHVQRIYEDIKPTVVIHCAGKVGGVAANIKAPGQFFYDNIRMNIFTTHYAYLNKVKKFVALLPGCSYPDNPPSSPHFKEEDYWAGFPEKSSYAYSLARKMLAIQNMAYNQEYGFKAVNLIPSNLYGLRDNFSLQDAHVVPALVRKFIEAVDQKKDSVPLWGTGKASRDFLYIEDCAEDVVSALEKVEDPEPINIGAGFYYTIREMAEKLADITGFKGELKWDTSKPEGQSHRAYDLSRQEQFLGIRKRTGLEEGLRKTVQWYRENQFSSTIRKGDAIPRHVTAHA